VAGLPATTIAARSSLYRTEPVGYNDQEEFLNAVVEAATELAPENLLARLWKLNGRWKENRAAEVGAASIDLDILLFGSRVVRRMS